MQLPVQPGGGGGGGGGGTYTHSVCAVAQYGSPVGELQGHNELQPLLTCRQLQPSVPGTPTQSHPVWQSTPLGVVEVAQSHVVVDVDDVLTQSGG